MGRGTIGESEEQKIIQEGKVKRKCTTIGESEEQKLGQLEREEQKLGQC